MTDPALYEDAVLRLSRVLTTYDVRMCALWGLCEPKIKPRVLAASLDVHLARRIAIGRLQLAVRERQRKYPRTRRAPDIFVDGLYGPATHAAYEHYGWATYHFESSLPHCNDLGVGPMHWAGRTQNERRPWTEGSLSP